MDEEGKKKIGLLNGVPYTGEDSIFFSFNVKYRNIPDNVAVHRAFKQFALEECDDNYIQAIKRLLESYQTDWKLELMQNEISDLRAVIVKVEESLEKKTEEKPKTVKVFGV